MYPIKKKNILNPDQLKKKASFWWTFEGIVFLEYSLLSFAFFYLDRIVSVTSC